MCGDIAIRSPFRLLCPKAISAMTDSVAPSRGPEQSTGPNPAPVEAQAEHDPPKPPPSPPAFASKANDLEALRSAVVDAANVSAGLWLSYLFALLYLAIAAGSVTHRDLLFEKSVKLPFLNVELPLVPFFVMGPGLFLVVHAYVLLHFMLLADKAGAFHQQLRQQIEDEDTRAGLRRQLPSNIFVQFVAGPPGVRSGGVGLMFRAIAQISLIVLPIGLFVLFQLQFLAYHSEPVTWWQRVAVVIDLALIWVLWPSINRGEISRLELRDFLRWRVAASAFASLLTILMVGTIATFPGEWLHTALPSVPVVPTTRLADEPYEEGWNLAPTLAVDAGPFERWRFAFLSRIEDLLLNVKFRSLHTLLIAGDVDPVTRRPMSLWSNRLVLPELNAASPSSEPLSLRGRRLEGAVLTAARMAGVDFTGAYLQEANFDGADLRSAQFGCGEATLRAKADPADVAKSETRFRLDNVTFRTFKNAYIRHDCARLQGASLRNASLQGAMLERSNMQGADLTRARLHGASMDDAWLWYVLLTQAELYGASLEHAKLDGADLASAKLYGAILTGVSMSRAELRRTELQGAQLGDASMEGANLDDVYIWRSDPPRPEERPFIDNLVFEARYEHQRFATCKQDRDERCLWTAETFEALKLSLQENVTDARRRNVALQRISRLDPHLAEQQSDGMAVWRNLAKASPTRGDDDDKKRRDGLRWAWCWTDDAPYIVHALLKRHPNVYGLEELAGDLLDESACPASRELSREDRRFLEKIKLGKASSKR
ncbi:hypothetical protein GWG65_06960 [Bradyrhizobium sp. CSA207]|uniref:pentapeptide repeat-containing protein n=1 Tax=Bradyrhizobium sp. CSA207 TaxID=2698826 RepID=UPI0023AECE39|nr:pentapeptide repeat-containing protein [Bradyrhizobium sp. CSA207]MDE5441196.1 hypothetical protein [Bradyrhizobium sp. CSA207]